MPTTEWPTDKDPTSDRVGRPELLHSVLVLSSVRETGE